MPQSSCQTGPTGHANVALRALGVALSTLLVACGSGYSLYGGFVWDSSDDDDPNVVVVVTASAPVPDALGAPSQLPQATNAAGKASAAVHAELRRMTFSTDRTAVCKAHAASGANADVYALELQGQRNTRKFLSGAQACATGLGNQWLGYVDAADLAVLHRLLSTQN